MSAKPDLAVVGGGIVGLGLARSVARRGVGVVLLERGAPFFAWLAAGYWKDIGGPRELLAANLDALDGRAGIRVPGQELSPGIWAEGESVTEGAAIEPRTALGEGCQLESGCRVCRAVIGPGARIPSGARLDGCVVGEGVEVPPIAARDAIFTPGRVVWV